MIVMASGGFDPLHVGHVRMLREAAQHGRVFVALNSDAWLVRKKGYAFMPFAERQEILLALPMVNMVLPVDDADGTVAEILDRIRPNFFVNGGDRTIADDKEGAVCKRIGIIQLFGIGGGKAQSSSALVRAARKSVPHQIVHHEYDDDPR